MRLLLIGWILIAQVSAQVADQPKKVYKTVFEHTIKADKYQDLVNLCQEMDLTRKASNPDYVPPARWIGVLGDGLRFLAEFESDTPPQNFRFWPETMTAGVQHLVNDTRILIYVSQFDASEKPLLTSANQKRYKFVSRHTIRPDGYPALAEWFLEKDESRKETNPEYQRPRRYFQIFGNALNFIYEVEIDSLNANVGIWPASDSTPKGVVTKLSREVYRAFMDVDE